LAVLPVVHSFANNRRGSERAISRSAILIVIIDH
jgi:hypothetical protein